MTVKLLTLYFHWKDLTGFLPHYICAETGNDPDGANYAQNI